MSKRKNISREFIDDSDDAEESAEVSLAGITKRVGLSFQYYWWAPLGIFFFFFAHNLHAGSEEGAGEEAAKGQAASSSSSSAQWRRG